MNAEEFEKLKEETLVLARESLIFKYHPNNLAEFERVMKFKNDPEADKDIILFCLNMFKELEKLIDDTANLLAGATIHANLEDMGIED